jgi:nicotinate-nucleotide adenylyltransferase
LAENKYNKCFGLLGGSFNPVHNGHIHCAYLAKKKLPIDKLLFIPAYISPFKSSQQHNNISLAIRLKMLNLILTENDEIIDYELLNKGISYTVNTVEYILNKFGKNIQLYLIIGSDNFNLFHKWNDYKKLLQLVKLAVVVRPGFSCNNKFIDDYIIIGKSKFNISSSEIRQKCYNNEDISDFVPNNIKEFILNERIYK